MGRAEKAKGRKEGRREESERGGGRGEGKKEDAEAYRAPVGFRGNFRVRITRAWWATCGKTC